MSSSGPTERGHGALLLTGPMGAGKTTVGPLVAARAGLPFVDLDEAIRVRAGAPSVGDLFASSGEPAFRALEAQELRRLLDDGTPRVVALGGGTLIDAVLRREALERARVLCLAAPAAVLAARTAASSVRRPALEVPDPEARLAEMLVARAAAYAETHGTIATAGRSAEQVADAVLAAWRDRAVPVLLGARGYAVRIAADAPAAVVELVRAAAPSSVVLVTDANVRPLVAAGIEQALARDGLSPIGVVVLPPGERHKTLASLETVLTGAMAAGADRSSLVLAVGGGVVTDTAGFAAATLFRGVRWAAVPTTLLSMVDASTGGKTGVDLGAAKNAVGAFHQPAGVVIGPAYVSTESARAYTSGLAEVVKAAAIRDAAFFSWLEGHVAELRARQTDAVTHAIEASVAIKARIVSNDEQERGERVVLNFGHTVGHALEAQGGFDTLTHGEAVSLGMVAALRVGRRLGTTSERVAMRVEALLNALGLPTDLDAQPMSDALPLVVADKKRVKSQIRFVLLDDIGATRTTWLDPEQISAALRAGP